MAAALKEYREPSFHVHMGRDNVDVEANLSRNACFDLRTTRCDKVGGVVNSISFEGNTFHDPIVKDKFKFPVTGMVAGKPVDAAVTGEVTVVCKNNDPRHTEIQDIRVSGEAVSGPVKATVTMKADGKVGVIASEIECCGIATGVKAESKKAGEYEFVTTGVFKKTVECSHIPLDLSFQLPEIPLCSEGFNAMKVLEGCSAVCTTKVGGATLGLKLKDLGRSVTVAAEDHVFGPTDGKTEITADFKKKIISACVQRELRVTPTVAVATKAGAVWTVGKDLETRGEFGIVYDPCPVLRARAMTDCEGHWAVEVSHQFTKNATFSIVGKQTTKAGPLYGVSFNFEA